MPFTATRLFQAFKKLGPSIDEKVAGKNILSSFEKNVQHHPHQPALFSRRNKNYTSWKAIDWNSYHKQAHMVASGLLHLGAKKNDVTLILSRNRAEHNIADIGILYSGCTPSSLYPTLKAPQIAKIASLTQSSIVFVDNEEILHEVLQASKHLSHIKHIITFENIKKNRDKRMASWRDFLNIGKNHLDQFHDTINHRSLELSPKDLACILFTSGTTGEPKGVEITHENILWTIESYLNTTNIVSDQPRMISYLPMAHITERVAHHYHMITRLGQLYFALEITDLKNVLVTARPTLFFAVPRVWEKFHNGLLEKIRLSGKEKLVHYAIQNGIRRVEYEQVGQKAPLHIRLQDWLFTKIIFDKMKKALGLDQTEIFGSGAAPLGSETQKFFHAIHIPITEVYGLTENTAPALSNYPSNRIETLNKLLDRHQATLPKPSNKIGSVGLPIPGTEVKIAKDGELLLKGKHIFQGYYKNRKATKEAFTHDGWFKTGDIALKHDNGMIQIIARKKEIIVTSGGKNIAPIEIENLIRKNHLIGSVCVIGDNRHFLSALITLNHEGGTQAWAEKNHLPHLPLEKMANHPLVYQAIDQHILEANEQLSRVQQVKKFIILPDPWTPQTGELTPTLKLKRFAIEEKFQILIQKMYRNSSKKNKAA